MENTHKPLQLYCVCIHSKVLSWIKSVQSLTQSQNWSFRVYTCLKCVLLKFASICHCWPLFKIHSLKGHTEENSNGSTLFYCLFLRVITVSTYRMYNNLVITWYTKPEPNPCRRLVLLSFLEYTVDNVQPKPSPCYLNQVNLLFLRIF